MARATRNSKPVAGVSSPPARRTRSKLKEREAAAAASSSSQPAASEAPTTTDPAPITDTAHPETAPTEEAPITTRKAPNTKSQSKKKAPARATKASASANNNHSSEESSDNNITTNTTKTRARRQPAVDRNAKNKVTKPRARKPTTKATATTKKAIEQHIEEEEVTAPPARTAPVRRTRAALKAGIASPLAPVSEDVDARVRKTKPKKSLKDATPLSIMHSKDDPQDDPVDDDDWFKDVQQEPRIYRDPGASMEEISEREEGNDDIVDHDTATSDGEGAMGEDVEMAVDHTDNGASETEADTANEEEDEDPHTPQQPAQPMELEAPTTARTFGITNILFNPLASMKKLLSRAATPAPTSPAPPSSMIQSPPAQSSAVQSLTIQSPTLQSPTHLSPQLQSLASPTPGSPLIASPSSAAHARKLRNSNKNFSRSVPATPREKNADKRHRSSETQASIAQLKREELVALLRIKDQQIAELKRQKQHEESQQKLGQKRQRVSPTVIPARRPGEKGSFGMLDEYFGDDDDDESIDDSHKSPPAKKRRTTNTARSSDDDSDTDSEYDFAYDASLHTPPSLLRPRNSYRMAAIKEGQEDPMLINHELRVMHQENSFSRSPLRDSPNIGNKTTPKSNKSSPSTIYNGSVMAMPGDPGYKPENVFKVSEEQMNEIKSIGKMTSDELKSRAEEIVKKQKSGEDITEAEKKLLDKAERRFGHIAGSGSFSAPEYDSDDDSIMSDDSDQNTSPPNTITSTAPPAESLQPPPAPTPAHAQLPATNTSVPKTPTTAPSTTSFQSAALARQRELAEKHKPKMGSRLQYVSEVSSSPVGSQSPDGSKEVVEEFLTTQPFEDGAWAIFDEMVDSSMDDSEESSISSEVEVLEGEVLAGLLTGEEKRLLEIVSEQEDEEKAFKVFDSFAGASPPW